MDTEERRVPLAEAQAVAESLLEAVRPYCLRCEIAGSIRRRRPFVKDIEIVAVQKVRSVEEAEIFGAKAAGGETPELWEHLDGLAKRGEIGYVKRGPLYRQFAYRGVKVDLFTAVRENWGIILFIRTGSAEFGKGAMVRFPEMGYRCAGGSVVREADRRVMETPEEEDVFRLLGVAPVDPKARERW